MAVSVDANNCVVRDGDVTLPFDIDWHDGSARIALGTQRYALRALRWREKRNLARFSHLGEQFLQTQFLRVSLHDATTELPSSAKQCAVLSALARWINAPEGDFGMPLDQQLLASVTLDLCRSMQLPPAALDAMDATQVELLWQATRAKQPEPQAVGSTATSAASAAVAPGMTRIVVLPDDSGTTEESAGNRNTEGRNSSQANPLRDENDLFPAGFTAAGIEAAQRVVDLNAIHQPSSDRNVAENAAAVPKAIVSSGNMLAAHPSINVRNPQSKNTNGKQTVDGRGRFRIDFTAPDVIAPSKKNGVNQNSAIAPFSVQRNEFSENSTDINTSTFGNAINGGNKQTVVGIDDQPPRHSVSADARNLFPAFFPPAASALAFADLPDPMPFSNRVARAAATQSKVAALVGESPNLAAQEAEFNITAMPQIADRLFDMFAERLGEAACAAGIDLEY